MSRILIMGLGGLALAIMGGCASLPDRIDELERARTAVESVDRDPLAERVAGAELKQAKQALQRADRIRDNNGELERIHHSAYIALRHADIVKERIAEAKAREQIERSEAERTRVLLDARASEADRARAEARQAAALAEARGAEAERQRRRADAAAEQAEALQESLQELKAEQTERGLVLTLSDVLFDTNEAELKPGAANAIDRLQEFLSDNDERRLLIEGHTDARGDEAYNQRLSERRAEAVRDALIERGVAADRMRAAGRGEAYPVATNDTTAGRQQNRRVEIVISDVDGEFPPSAERATSLR
ncbi:MAG: OmpA family protein [Pseudomonadota bacterium]